MFLDKVPRNFATKYFLVITVSTQYFFTSRYFLITDQTRLKGDLVPREMFSLDAIYLTRAGMVNKT
jgi:hypothetical protein